MNAEICFDKDAYRVLLLVSQTKQPFFVSTLRRASVLEPGLFTLWKFFYPPPYLASHQKPHFKLRAPVLFWAPFPPLPQNTEDVTLTSAIHSEALESTPKRLRYATVLPYWLKTGFSISSSPIKTPPSRAKGELRPRGKYILRYAIHNAAVVLQAQRQLHRRLHRDHKTGKLKTRMSSTTLWIEHSRPTVFLLYLPRSSVGQFNFIRKWATLRCQPFWGWSSKAEEFGFFFGKGCLYGRQRRILSCVGDSHSKFARILRKTTSWPCFIFWSLQGIITGV